MQANAPLRIRRGTRADVQCIADFQEAMATESEGKVLDRPTLEAGIVGLLARPHAGWYLVADLHGEAAGSLMVTPEWSDWRNGWFWWIQSVYVAPAGRRRGVYTALHTQVRDDARGAESVVGLRLYVDHLNVGARATYERLGMAETAYRFYECGLA